jgi:eukaryotic-like serine/threonine-protein kinase
MPDYLTQLNLRARIGEGQFGEVYEAECPVHGKVAVKLLRQNPNESDTDWAARSTELIGEAKRLKSAQHRNVVAVHQIVKDPRGVLHLVIEFCSGGSLAAEYEADPMPVLRARKVITDVCAGLECIHSNGMVHRDIKPANVLSEGTTYKLGDFGLVTDRLVHGYASADGYISHLAPEVFDTSSGTIGVTSPRSDIWALGMTLYRLLHGDAFFVDNFGLLNADDFQQRITKGGFSQTLPWLPHIPDRWRRFVRKAMHDDLGQRFQSAHEMSQSLASLPIEPNWTCHYVYGHVTWRKTELGRTTTVEWRIQSPRKHLWSAVRSGGGKSARSIAGSRGNVVSALEVKKQLEDFFHEST